MSVWWSVQSLRSRRILDLRILAFHVLHRSNAYSFLLESSVGPIWPRASRPHRVDEPLGVVVLVWIIPDVLGHCTEVTFVVTHENGTCWPDISSRYLRGALNSNSGLIKGVVAEIIDSTVHTALSPSHGFLVHPSGWCLFFCEACRLTT